MLTCACGARFEVDDSLAGQEVLCPECQQTLKAPPLDRPPQVTSGLALASVVLALVAAFTVVGTVAAVLLGLAALVSIARNRPRLSGAGFAVLGICLGLLFTALTVFALSASEVFGLEAFLRERNLGAKIDTSGPMEVVVGDKGFAITRPGEKWGRLSGELSGDPAVSDLQRDRDLLLMQLSPYGFVDVRVRPGGRPQSLDQCKDEVLAELESQPRPHNPFADDDDDDDALRPVRRLAGHTSRDASRDGMEGREISADVRGVGRQSWHFLIRLYRRGNGRVFVVRAYAPKKRFDAVRGQMESALDSFRILRP